MPVNNNSVNSSIDRIVEQGDFITLRNAIEDYENGTVKRGRKIINNEEELNYAKEKFETAVINRFTHLIRTGDFGALYSLVKMWSPSRKEYEKNAYWKATKLIEKSLPVLMINYVKRIESKDGVKSAIDKALELINNTGEDFGKWKDIFRKANLEDLEKRIHKYLEDLVIFYAAQKKEAKSYLSSIARNSKNPFSRTVTDLLNESNNYVRGISDLENALNSNYREFVKKVELDLKEVGKLDLSFKKLRGRRSK